MNVESFSSEGDYLGAWGVLGDGDSELNDPITMDVDAAGTVCILEFDGHVKQFAPDATLLQVWSSGHSSNSQDIGVGPDGVVYLTRDRNERVESYSADGTFIGDWSLWNIAVNAVAPELVVGPNGSVYVAAFFTSRVQRYASDGTILAEFATGASVDDIAVIADPEEAVAGADAVYTDVHVSMGQRNVPTREVALVPYKVTPRMMAEAAPHAVFMHCMPMHRDQEVDTAVVDGPQSIIFEQAENRLHVHKALLLQVLAGNA